MLHTLFREPSLLIDIYNQRQIYAEKFAKRLNALAINGIKPGGITFTFSCSQVVDKYLFHGAITAAAIETGRTVRIIRYLSHPADHPISIYHPEGEYLKGMMLQVE